MFRTISRRFAFSIAALVLIAIVSGGFALRSAYRLEHLIREVAEGNFENLQAALLLENALLEQKGLVTSALASGGHAASIQELEWRRRTWQPAFDRVRRVATRASERRILEQLDAAYHRYDSTRETVVQQIRDGRLEEARNLHMSQVIPMGAEVHALCERIVVEEELGVAAAMAEARARVLSASVAVYAGLGLALIAGALLVVVLMRRVFTPLRRLARQAQGFSAESAETHDVDPLGVLERSFDSLTQEAARARASLSLGQQQIDRADALGRLAASVAHEVRSPLQTMSFALHSLRKDVDHDPGLAGRCDLLKGEIDRLEKIVRHLLDFAKPKLLQMEPVRVDELIHPVLELLDERLSGRGLSVYLANGKPSPRVCGDASQLRQIFVNLIGNAMDAMPDGGTIRIRPEVESAEEREWAVIRVQDEGHGVPPMLRDHIFEPFTTSKQQGTGLGLSISADIAQRHGGRLELESSGERGTTFALRLPLVSD